MALFGDAGRGFVTGFPGLTTDAAAARRAQGERAKLFRAARRRSAALRAAAELIPLLPGPGEALHTLLLGYFDFALALTHALRSRPSPCLAARISTLSFSRRNVEEAAGWLDRGEVVSLTLLCCDYMRRMNSEAFQVAVDELVTKRGQVVAEAKTHAKVATLHFADGVKLAFEGSMNLRSARNVEQMTVVNDAGVHDWHAAWIDERAAAGGQQA